MTLEDLTKAKGFIVLNRALLDSWLWRVPAWDFKLAVGCLFYANYAERVFFDGSKSWPVPRGTFIRSVGSLCRDLGEEATPKKVRGGLQRLQAADFLKLGTAQGKRHTTITVLNYELYQSVPKVEGTTQGKVRAKSGQSEGKVRATREPSNKGTEEPGNQISIPLSEVETSDGDVASASKPKKLKPAPPELAIRAATYLQRNILKSYPGHKLATSFTETQKLAWARVIEGTHRIDGRSYDDIKTAIEWLHQRPNSPQSGGFVIFSAQSLRDKFDNIRARMAAGQPASQLPVRPPPLRQPERIRGESNEDWNARMAAKKAQQA